MGQGGARARSGAWGVREPVGAGGLARRGFRAPRHRAGAAGTLTVCRPPVSKLYFSSKSHLGSDLKSAACSRGRCCVAGLWGQVGHRVARALCPARATAVAAPSALLPASPAPASGTSARLSGADVPAVAAAAPRGSAGPVPAVGGVSSWSCLPLAVRGS